MSEDEAAELIEAQGAERVRFLTADFDHGTKHGIAVEFYRGETRHRNAVRYPEGATSEEALAELVRWATERLSA